MKRTPKKIVECCPRCKRDGWEQEEWFALCTEEEWGDRFESQTRRRLKEQYPYAEACIVRPGATINKAVAEAKEISRLMGRLVVFEFNRKDVQVGIDSDVDTVVRHWWKQVYGETPEESFAKR